jgi:hypothetical protein
MPSSDFPVREHNVPDKARTGTFQAKYPFNTAKQEFVH